MRVRSVRASSMKAASHASAAALNQHPHCSCCGPGSIAVWHIARVSHVPHPQLHCEHAISSHRSNLTCPTSRELLTRWHLLSDELSTGKVTTRAVLSAEKLRKSGPSGNPPNITWGSMGASKVERHCVCQWLKQKSGDSFVPYGGSPCS
jgi:hypothetical protein